MTKYRVTYPLITTDGHRDFDTREQAETFANTRRNAESPFLTIHSWQRVQITEVEVHAADCRCSTCSFSPLYMSR